MSAVPPTVLPDELWYSFRQGDERAFQQIYRLYARDLLTYGYKITNDVPLIEDSIHDLFIELWLSRANLSDTDSIKFYLFRSLRNKISRMRSQNLFFQASDIESIHPLADSHTIESQLIEREETEAMYLQLGNSYRLLTPRQQEALNLRFYQHFSNEEIAQIMGVNYQSACRFIYSALKTLREAVRILSVWLVCTDIARLLKHLQP